MQTPGNPDGPLTATQAAKMTAALAANQDSFYDQFVTDYMSANGVLKVANSNARMR
jgi:hypothetical protein